MKPSVFMLAGACALGWIPAPAAARGGAAPARSAQAEASAEAAVHVRVVPALAVRTETPAVDAGEVRTGRFSASVRFHVSANLPEVSMHVQASAMHRGGDPRAGAAIPLDEAAGVRVAPGGSGGIVAALVAPGDAIDGLPTRRTETVTFHGGQGGFSHDVLVTVTWDQSDPNRPVGEYAARVRLTAMILPPE